MPCNSVTVQSVGGLENALPDLVKAALGSFGQTWERDGSLLVRGVDDALVEWRKGRGLEVSARSQAAADKARGAVLQAYSKAAVNWAAKRAGWRVQAVPGVVNRLVVQRG